VAEPRHGTGAAAMVLSLAALGVVFGDIGTSPIYTLPVCFQFSGAAPTAENVLGICSLIVWTLVLVVCTFAERVRRARAGRPTDRTRDWRVHAGRSDRMRRRHDLRLSLTCT
jgi:K+ potassium transporter